jgi:hypothetical protein
MCKLSRIFSCIACLCASTRSHGDTEADVYMHNFDTWQYLSTYSITLWPHQAHTTNMNKFCILQFFTLANNIFICQDSLILDNFTDQFELECVCKMHSGIKDLSIVKHLCIFIITPIECDCFAFSWACFAMIFTQLIVICCVHCMFMLSANLVWCKILARCLLPGYLLHPWSHKVEIFKIHS